MRQMAKAKQYEVVPRKASRVLWALTWATLPTCIFLIAIPLLLHILSLPNANTSSSLSKPNTLNSFPRNTSTKGEDDRGEQFVEIISWEPRAFLYHNFLTKQECEYLINLAKPHMRKSTVIDETTGNSVKSRARTSTGAFLPREHDKIVANIEKRIADFSFIPIEHGEGLHIIHYKVGQKFEPHFDYFLDKFSIMKASQRVATMLMYLSTVEEGGETVFPEAKGNFSSVSWWNELSKCGKLGLSIKPKMGDALLFWNIKPDGTLDPLSLHGSCPVIKGDKWSCTKWMHVKEFVEL